MVALPAEPVNIPPKVARFIYITGCDGTGKTTQVSLLLEKLEAAGVKTRHVWLRFPFFFSLPLLAYARWHGLSWYEQDAKARHGYWDFRRSKLLRNILPWTLLIDASLAGLAEILIPLWRGDTIVCERFVLDMLVDLSVAFGVKDLHQQLPGALYLKLLPQDAKIVVLDLDAATIQARRADLCTDKFLQARLESYQHLSDDLSLQRFSSILPVNTLNELIIKVAAS